MWSNWIPRGVGERVRDTVFERRWIPNSSDQEWQIDFDAGAIPIDEYDDFVVVVEPVGVWTSDAAQIKSRHEAKYPTSLTRTTTFGTAPLDPWNGLMVQFSDTNLNVFQWQQDLLPASPHTMRFLMYTHPNGRDLRRIIGDYRHGSGITRISLYLEKRRG